MVLLLNHPAKVFSVTLDYFGEFQRKSFTAERHRKHRVSPNSFLLFHISFDLQLACKSN